MSEINASRKNLTTTKVCDKALIGSNPLLEARYDGSCRGFCPFTREIPRPPIIADNTNFSPKVKILAS